MIGDVTEQVVLAATVESGITWDTPLEFGGEPALRMANICAYDTEELCLEMLRFAARLSAGSSDEADCASLLRMYALRIKQLNGIVMSYLAEDCMPLREVHQVIHGTFPVEGSQP